MFNLQKIRSLQTLVPRFSLKFLYALICSISAVWLTCALWSFDRHDPSIIYISSYKLFCSNWCGTTGAHTAALFFFLCGSAAYVCIFFLFFLAHRFFFKQSFKRDFDVIIAYFILLMAIAGLSNIFNVDPMNAQVPGGVVGYVVIHMLNKIFDTILSSIFLSILLMSSLVLILRVSYLIIGRFCVKIIFSVCQLLYYVIPITQFLLKKIKNFFMHLYHLFDGSQVHNENFSIVDFEAGIDNSQEYDEAALFWNERFAKPSEKLPDQHNKEKQSLSLNRQQKDSSYIVPPTSFFLNNESTTTQTDQIKNNQLLAKVLEEKLERFGINGTVVSIKVGPVITLFEYQPHIDSKISKIIALEDDLALALQAVSIRIIAPIPGKSVVGFEVANKHRRNVLLGKVLQSSEFQESSCYLPLVLGEDSIGNTVIVDLATMPHLLVAGSTGSGKSVALNAMLISLLCKFSPQQLKLILIDPKRLEFAAYADIPHLLVPIVTDPRKATPVLKWVVTAMEQRYEHMEQCRVRNIFDYHLLCKQLPELEPMPFMVIIIDELSDLMMTASKEIEDLIARITQMARAAGIHMIVATQRPSVDVITGLIKVNFPSRISFRVTSKIDSRTILDCNGADKLLGKGDMLFLDSSSRLQRAHGAFVSESERAKFIAHIRQQQPVEYIDIMQDIDTAMNIDFFEEDATLYQDVIQFVNTIDEVSISLLQRKFRIGYNRSARIIDRLQADGIIMQEPGGKTRKVIK